MGSTTLLISVIVTALAFDFTNGFHDTANAVATAIATGALRPCLAVLLSAPVNVAGAFLSLKVATTIAKGIIDSSQVTLTILAAALLGDRSRGTCSPDCSGFPRARRMRSSAA